MGLVEKAEREKEIPGVITFGSVLRRFFTVGYMNTNSRSFK